MKKQMRILAACVALVLSSSSAYAGEYAYTIQFKEGISPAECRLVVQLDRMISADELASLARRLRSDECPDYEKVFIRFFLPGMVIGDAPWAAASLTPRLEVKILGVSREQEMRQEEARQREEIVGRWVDDLLDQTIIIVRAGPAYHMKRQGKDGAMSTRELIPIVVNGRQAFREKGREDGVYLMIDASGNLGQYGSSGLVIPYRVGK